MSVDITVLVVEPMKPCYTKKMRGLKEMQAIVGGPIQAVYPFRDTVVLVCNEEGKHMGLPYNRPLTNDRGVPYDMICGTFFLAGLGDENFVSLTDDQIRSYKKMYDSMMVLSTEMPAVKAELVPNSDLRDFAVACEVVVHFPFVDELEKEMFTMRVNSFFNRDKILSNQTVGDLTFEFGDSHAKVCYILARCDKDKTEAERFGTQCSQKVQDWLNKLGYQNSEITCLAEELEADPPPRNPQNKKKGKRYER